jgi:hypothetical protein
MDHGVASWRWKRDDSRHRCPATTSKDHDQFVHMCSPNIRANWHPTMTVVIMIINSSAEPFILFTRIGSIHRRARERAQVLRVKRHLVGVGVQC